MFPTAHRAQSSEGRNAPFVPKSLAHPCCMLDLLNAARGYILSLTGESTAGLNTVQACTLGLALGLVVYFLMSLLSAVLTALSHGLARATGLSLFKELAQEAPDELMENPFSIPNRVREERLREQQQQQQPPP